MRTLEHIARKICERVGDDPDLMAYPPMMLPVANGIRHVTIAPTEDYCQPRPLWTWYLPQAEAAVRALVADTYSDVQSVVERHGSTITRQSWNAMLRDIMHEKEG